MSIPDGGTTWTPVFAQGPARDPGGHSFSPQTVSLAQFAGHIVLRFRSPTAGGNGGTAATSQRLVHRQRRPVGGAGGRYAGAERGQPSPGVHVRNSQQGPSPSTRGRSSPTPRSARRSRLEQRAPSRPSAIPGWSRSPPPPTRPRRPASHLHRHGHPGRRGGTVSFTDNGQPASGCQSHAMNGGQATCAQTYTFGSTTPSSPPTAATGTSRRHLAGAHPTVNAPQSTTVALTRRRLRSRRPAGHLDRDGRPTDGGGTVNFNALEDSSANCTSVPLNAAGQATCVTSFSNPRVQSQMQAFYSGDPNFAANSPSVRCRRR